jgi:hypothetical protein
MISICMPVYNYNITRLITENKRKMHSFKNEFEVIVIDYQYTNIENLLFFRMRLTYNRLSFPIYLPQYIKNNPSIV